MKVRILIFIVWMAGHALVAQPVLENIYTESVNICRLESAGEVYYSMDVVNHQCHIYRMDHSLYKSIPIPIPEGYYHSDVQFVSENLFNEDPLVELVYSYVKYVPTETSYYYTYDTKLINENGAVLLTVPGAGYTNVIEVPEQGRKFLVYQYNYSVIPYRTYTHVYSLPDTETSALEHAAIAPGVGDAFPNPAGRTVNIPLQLPRGSASGNLEFYDVNGRLLLSQPVSGSFSNLFLPGHLFPPGTYFYQLESGMLRSQARKIVIAE